MWKFSGKKDKEGLKQEQDMLQAFTPAVDIQCPQPLTSPILLSSPHSGNIYPDAFLQLSKLPLLTLRLVEDAYVHEFIDPFSKRGIAVIKTRFPRCIIDVNRGPDELPRSIAKILAPKAPLSTRAKIGMGVIPMRIGNDDEIYHEPILVAAAQSRLEHLYQPFHEGLATLIENMHTTFGHAFLIDCHSMPGSSSGIKRPDIILGTRYGKSCHPKTADLVENAFINQGFSVVRDYPYAGGFITKTYGQPNQKTQAIQIEINKDLYLDPVSIEKTATFKHTHARMTKVLETIIGTYTANFSIAAQ